MRRKVESNSLALADWQSFLRINDNKSELFHYLSNQLVEENALNNLVFAFDNVCKTTCSTNDMSLLYPTNHEEATSRLFLHVKDLARQGSQKIAIRAVDADVLVLAVSLYYDIQHKVNKLRVVSISFGVRKDRWFFPVHEMFKELGSDKSIALRFFHSFSGCDQTSFMSYVSKTSAWNL